MKKLIKLSLLSVMIISIVCSCQQPAPNAEASDEDFPEVSDFTETPTASQNEPNIPSEINEEAETLPNTDDIPISEQPVSEYFELSLNRDLTQSDIEVLKQYKSIYLTIEEKNIDISLLSQLDLTEELIFSQHIDKPGAPPLFYISDFSFLKGMASLKSLELDCGDFEFDMNCISELTNLESLIILNSTITTNEKINNFDNLKELKIWFSNVETIDPFCELNLNSLDLYACSFAQKNLDAINEISELEFLNISFCDDVELTTLKGLKKLKILNLDGSSINWDIEIIYELSWLEECSVVFRFITGEQARKYMEINPNCKFYITDA